MALLRPENTVAILLAAGLSRRFEGDKLIQTVGGKSILSQSARALTAAGCFRHVGVIGAGNKARRLILEAEGFEVIENPDASEGLSYSIRVGLKYSEGVGAEGVMIALADMPLVSEAHYKAMFIAADTGNADLIYSVSSGKRMPPALFAKTWFSRLSELNGDKGARDLLIAAPPANGVELSDQQSLDVDTRADLVALKSGQSE